MKKVPVDLLPALNAGAEKLQFGKTDYGISTSRPPVEINGHTYDKEHDIPEGYYLAQLRWVESYSNEYFKMELKILSDVTGKQAFKPTHTLIGYIEKSIIYERFADCFGGELFFSDLWFYYFGIGVIRLTQSNGVECTNTFQWSLQFGANWERFFS